MNHVAAPEAVARSAAGPHRRIADIELLRGVAVVMVVVEHLPFNLIVWHSALFDYLTAYCRLWPGVDLFFAISGFVIGRNLLPMIHSGPDRLAFLNATLAFWTRRAWRLLPSAWLWLLIPLGLSIVFNRGGFFGTPGANYQDMVAAVLNVWNFHFGENYGRLATTVMFPYWSLSLEEQFYLALPVLIFLFRRRLGWLLGLVVLLQFHAPATPVAMVTRTGALALGVLIAMWSGQPGWRLCEPRGLAGSWPARAAVLAAGVLLLGALGSDVMTIASFRLALIMLVSGGLVWVASYDRDYLIRGLLPRRPMLWLGSRSFSIYLIHAAAFAATREIWFRLSPPGKVVGGSYTLRYGLTALVFILTLSELNHRLVEQPLRRRGARIAQAMASRRLPA